MTPNIYYPSSASLTALSSLHITFIGYGNQGRAQALNLADSLKSTPLPTPPTILIANREDAYLSTAKSDNFTTTTNFADAASKSDVLFLLVPDQVQPKLFNEKIAPTLKKGCTVVVASGFNVFYGRLNVPEGCDTVMVAPRMIGTSVRSLCVEGKGFPCFVSVEKDGTGKALERTLALAQGIGALKTGAVECSARDETLMDLFAEQALWPSIIVTFREAYSTLKKLGCSDEALVHELWLSKEPAEVFEKCAEDGFIKQLRHHSSVSQYGQLSTSLSIDTEKSGMQKFFKEVAEKRILGGEFVKEFTDIDDSNGGDGIERKLEELYKLSSTSELVIGETKVRERMGLGKV